MSFNELELKRIDRTVGELCRRKTRPEYADQLRFECEIDGHTVTVWEVRPPWDGVGDRTRMGVARFRFFRSRGVWQLYWMRRQRSRRLSGSRNSTTWPIPRVATNCTGNCCHCSNPNPTNNMHSRWI